MPDDVVAIDGPSASGKSTVARAVAKELGRHYVDSGALYRAVTWYALEQGVDCNQPGDVIDLLSDFPVEFFVESGAVRFRVAGIQPVTELRTDSVVENVSAVAAIPEVRQQVTHWLRAATEHGPLVMEGRDIGSTVFPDAIFRFYLDADPEERARRRQSDTGTQDREKSVSDVLNSLKMRDNKDRSRAASPLQISKGAIIVDSTGLGIEDVLGLILEKIREGV